MTEAWRLNWNFRTNGDDVLEVLDEGQRPDLSWRCGNSQIHKGDRLYLLRLGDRIRGIVGAGVATDDANNGAVDVSFHLLAADPIVPWERLRAPPFDQINKWDIQTQAIRVPIDAADELDRLMLSGKAETEEDSGANDGLEFDRLPTSDADARTWISRVIALRRGQAKFRDQLMVAYGARCAITGCDAAAALEAAHIRPYRGEHTHHVRNGLLLRADIHTLFDDGKLTIDVGAGTVVLHPELRNGHYANLHGRPVSVPENHAHRPDHEALMDHRRRAGF